MMATTAANGTWGSKYGATARGRFGSKSGFSPTDYILPTLANSSNPERVAVKNFQRAFLYGFTTRELGQLDCLPTRELLPGNLSNDIIPMLRRENWERAPPQPDFTRDHLYPLRNGNRTWSGDNDDVWEILEPVVRMTSRMLMSIHFMPWVCMPLQH